MKPTKKVIQETKAIIRLHYFLRYDCELRYADELSAKDFKQILYQLHKQKY